MTFEQQLKKDIYKRFMFLSTSLGIIIILSILISLILINTDELSHNSNSIRQNFIEQREVIKSLTVDLSNRYSKEMITDLKNANERALYTKFYQELPQSNNAYLMVLDHQGNIQFSNNRLINKHSIVPNYLKNVIQTIGSDKNTFFERVTIDIDQQQFYIGMSPILDNNQLLGYTVIAVNGQLFNDQSQDTINYMITDNFDNILIKNSNRFVIGNGAIPKIDSSKFENNLYIESSWLYLLKKTQISEKIFLYLYKPVLNINIFLSFALLMITFAFLFLVIESNRISKKIAQQNAKAINQLKNEMGLIMRGYKFHVSYDQPDEFGYLAKQINLMIDGTQKLYNNALDLEKQKNHLEKTLLDVQFNPHFLYNTLETIRITSQFDIRTTETLIYSLTAVLRYSLDSVNSWPRLKQDIEILKNYLEIIRIRFEDFDYTVEFDESFYQLEVPKLFLLPLIENAIKYGFQVQNELKIWISGYRDREYYVIDLYDNGPQFSENIDAIIKRQIKANETHHGLCNTYRRMQWVFKEVKIENLQINQEKLIRLKFKCRDGAKE